MTALLKGKIVLVAAAVLLLGQGVDWTQGGPPAQAGPVHDQNPADAPETGPIVAPGPEPDVVLLYTGGVIGYVEPCG